MQPPGPRVAEKRRRQCEDFAPHNGVTSLSGEGGAKKFGRRASGRLKRGGGNVKILLPITESKALAGRGEQNRHRPVPGAHFRCDQRLVAEIMTRKKRAAIAALF